MEILLYEVPLAGLLASATTLVALLTIPRFVTSTAAIRVTMTAGIALVCCVSFTLLLVAAGLGSCYDCDLDRRPFALVAFLWIASLIIAPVVLRCVWKRADPAVGVARRLGAMALGLGLGVGGCDRDDFALRGGDGQARLKALEVGNRDRRTRPDELPRTSVENGSYLR